MRTRSTGVISSSRVRIGLIFRAPTDPGAGAADPAAAAQVLEGVDREPHLQLLAGPLGAGERRRRRRRPPPAAADGAEHGQAHAAGRRARVHDADPLAALVLVDQPLARLVRGLEGAGDPGGDVDRDDFLAGVEQRLVDGEEVADRGLRGGGAAFGGAQPLVEAGEIGDIELALLLAVDGDVEADPLDAPLLDQVQRKVGGGVADDGGRGARVQPAIFADALPRG